MCISNRHSIRVLKLFRFESSVRYFDMVNYCMVYGVIRVVLAFWERQVIVNRQNEYQKKPKSNPIQHQALMVARLLSLCDDLYRQIRLMIIVFQWWTLSYLDLIKPFKYLLFSLYRFIEDTLHYDFPIVTVDCKLIFDT